jgi:hypothetical protein
MVLCQSPTQSNNNITVVFLHAVQNSAWEVLNPYSARRRVLPKCSENEDVVGAAHAA